jgi:hypothetical protein
LRIALGGSGATSVLGASWARAAGWVTWCR